MKGLDPYAYFTRLAGKMDSLTDRHQIERVLDETEYLFEVIPPELQHLADPLIDTLRKKL